MKTVELQPYALHRISRDLPIVHRQLGDFQPVVPLVRQGREEFVVKVLEHRVSFRCPAQFRPLFFREPGVHASHKVEHLLQESYEHWLQMQAAAYLPE